MTYTLTQRDALRQAIANGILRITYDGKTVEYRSFADLKAALIEVETGLAKASGKPTARRVRIYADKGL